MWSTSSRSSPFVYAMLVNSLFVYLFIFIIYGQSLTTKFVIVLGYNLTQYLIFLLELNFDKYTIGSHLLLMWQLIVGMLQMFFSAGFFFFFWCLWCVRCWVRKTIFCLIFSLNGQVVCFGYNWLTMLIYLFFTIGNFYCWNNFLWSLKWGKC